MSRGNVECTDWWFWLETRQPIRGYGVAKVLDSGNPNFKEGDLVRGITGWEEYNLITTPAETLIKIEHIDVPLSYYTGILGKLPISPMFEITDMVTVANY